jgi:cytochrome c biogenesis protein CcmG/thiol:disulfide interchange protein DsbE
MSLSRKSLTGPEKFWTSSRIIGTFVVLSLIAAFGFSSCTSSEGPKTRSSGTPASAPQRVAPTPEAIAKLPDSLREAQLTAIDGTAFKLADYSGKVMVVNLWATWCGPCRQEMPELVKLYQEFKSQGLEIVGLTTENPTTAAAVVKDFVRQQGVKYRIGWASGEFAWTLMQGRNSIPQSLIIDRDGRVVKRFVGFSVTQTPPQLRQAIEDALNNKSGA